MKQLIFHGVLFLLLSCNNQTNGKTIIEFNSNKKEFEEIISYCKHKYLNDTFSKNIFPKTFRVGNQWYFKDVRAIDDSVVTCSLKKINFVSLRICNFLSLKEDKTLEISTRFEFVKNFNLDSTTTEIFEDGFVFFSKPNVPIDKFSHEKSISYQTEIDTHWRYFYLKAVIKDCLKEK